MVQGTLLNTLYWVGLNISPGFSLRCYRKTQMNILDKPVTIYKEEQPEKVCVCMCVCVCIKYTHIYLNHCAVH